ncbi:hypothetical protein ACDY97_17910, partial [Rhizobium mongolense]|uniref:hypothetical protein n=1 Tax=Rhizobium mongolense TaxID=57676 RepID=UPI003558CE47
GLLDQIGGPVEKFIADGALWEISLFMPAHPVSSTKGTGLLESMPRSEPHPRSSAFVFGFPAPPRRTKGRQEINTRAIVGTAVAQRQLVDAATKKTAADQQRASRRHGLMKCHRTQGQISVARFHEVARRSVFAVAVNSRIPPLGFSSLNAKSG